MKTHVARQYSVMSFSLQEMIFITYNYYFVYY